MNNKIFVPNLSLVGKNKRRLTHHTHAGNQISVQIQAKLQNNYIFFFLYDFSDSPKLNERGLILKCSFSVELQTFKKSI